MIITSWIQSPSWIIWTHYLTPSLGRNPPASSSLRRCCEIWIATKAAHAKPIQPLLRQVCVNKTWLPLTPGPDRCFLAITERALDETNIDTAILPHMGWRVLARRWARCSGITARKNRERGQPRTLAGKGDTRGLIREREKQRNSTWQRGWPCSSNRWVMDFFSFFSRNCRWAPAATVKDRLECSPEVLPNQSVYMDRGGSVGASVPQRRHNSWNTVDRMWNIKA